MAYVKQVWIDNDLSKPLSAERLNHIEDGIDNNSVENVLDPSSSKASNNGIVSKVLLTDIMPNDYVLTTGAVYIADGTLYDASYYRSFRFKNPKFKYIRVRVSTTSSLFAAIAFYSGTEVSSSTYMSSYSVPFNSSDSMQELFAEVPEGCQLVVVTSRFNIEEPKVLVSSEYLFTELQKTTDLLDPTLHNNVSNSTLSALSLIEAAEEDYTVVNAYWVRYTNGKIESSSSYFTTFRFENPQFKYIRVFGQCNDNLPAIIAFYNSTTPSEASYMGSASVQYPSISTAGCYAGAIVPEGCKYIIVTSRKDNITPKVWISLDGYVKADHAKINATGEQLTWLASTPTSGNQSPVFAKQLKKGDLIKIVIHTYNFALNDGYHFNLQNSDSSLYSDIGFVARSVGTYYIRCPFDNYNRVYRMNTQENVTYDVYLVENPDYVLKHNPELEVPELLSNKPSVNNSEVKYANGTYVNDSGTYGEVRIAHSNSRISSQYIYYSGGVLKVTCSDAATYNYAIVKINTLNGRAYKVGDTGWISSTSEQKLVLNYGDVFAVSFRKMEGGSQVNIPASEGPSINISFDVSNLIKVPPVLNDFTKYEGMSEDISKLNYSREFKLENMFTKDKNYGHLFIDDIYDTSNPVVPSESIYDVAISARLGFKVVEGNIQKTATTGKYVVAHGISGTVGGLLVTTGGQSAASVVFANTSFNDLRNNYVYKSTKQKYKTPIASLEEWLAEVKANGMIPLASYVDDTEVAIIKSYFGDNFILYNGTRSAHKGMIMRYSSSMTYAQIEDLCQIIGAPLLITLTDISNFTTDEDLFNMVKMVHSYNCKIGIVGCYTSIANQQRAFKNGFDVNVSACEVNYFYNGDVAHYEDDDTFSNFVHTGTVANGVLHLDQGQTLTVGSLPSQVLAKQQIRIRYNGTININIPHGRDGTGVMSDGKQTLVFSGYLLNQVPTFTITASASTDIISLEYFVAKC